MAKRSTRKKAKKKMPQGIKLIILFAVFLIYSFAIYFKGMGILGKFFSDATLGLFGFFGFLMPFIIFFVTLFKINKNFKNRRVALIIGILLLFISLMLMMDIVKYANITEIRPFSINGIKKSYAMGKSFDSSGVVGDFFSVLIGKVTGRIGLGIVSTTMLIISIFLITNMSVRKIGLELSSKRNNRQRQVKQKADRVINTYDEKEIEPEIEPEPKVTAFKAEKSKKFIYDDYFGKSKSEEKTPLKAKKVPVIISNEDKPKEVEKIENPTEKESIEVKEEIEKNISTSSSKSSSYKKPKVSFLKKIESDKSSSKNNSEIYKNSERLENILLNFGIRANVVGVTRGPIVNRYEIELEPGTKLSKLHSLSDDIALNLAVSHVRIAAVVGKAAVGIEVPNTKKSMVSLRDIIESREFKNKNSLLKFALGKDISGKPIVGDLHNMPHLLIAGATGSGKSVCVNTIITSILYNASPDEVKLLMIDPKMVELNVYNGIPHLILPVVTDPKKAAIALNWAVNEMTERYEKFANTRSKDIDSYNSKNPEDKMHKIVVLIDELSDLMMVASSQVEDAIARLTQMARAAGIHLIVATQRPSVDVITGTIKSNIPSRIAFSVSSYVDSKTILDKSGAEKLIGKGDMLFKGPASNEAKRIQGAFISEDEIETIVSYIKNQNLDVSYNDEVVEKKVVVSTNDFDDDLYEDAVKLVIANESASASMLQRKFRIGYNRAGRLIDMMEDAGIIGPPQGSKPREVLMPNYFDEAENDN